MPDVEIIKLKLRRGTDVQRKAVILEQGELGYTTDTKRVWVGDGIISGGNVVGNVAHAPLNVANKTGITNAVTGDIVYERGLLFQLSGTDYSKLTSWGFIGTQADNDTIEYNTNNKLRIRSLSAEYAPYSGLIDEGVGTRINVDNKTLYVTSTTGVLSVSAVDQKHIQSSSFGNGIRGGSGSTILLDVDTSQFGFVSNQLQLTAIDNGIVDVDALSSNSIGEGLRIISNKLEAVLKTVDSNTIINNGSGVISLNTIHGGGSGEFTNVIYDTYGRVISQNSTIRYSLSVNPNITGIGMTGSTSMSALSAEQFFRGYYDEPQGGATNTTLYRAISVGSSGAPNSILTLSSAGFIVLIDDGPGSRLAVPAFLF